MFNKTELDFVLFLFKVFITKITIMIKNIINQNIITYEKVYKINGYFNHFNIGFVVGAL